MQKLGFQLKKVLHADPYTYCVSLLFSDGSQGIVDLSSIFDCPKGLAAEILRGNLFGSCFIEAGALAWPNGLELCPDMLHMNLEKFFGRKANRISQRRTKAA